MWHRAGIGPPVQVISSQFGAGSYSRGSPRPRVREVRDAKKNERQVGARRQDDEPTVSSGD